MVKFAKSDGNIEEPKKDPKKDEKTKKKPLKPFEKCMSESKYV